VAVYVTMNTKLTLRLDEDLIRRAKRYSRDRGKPVSQVVADYFAVLTDRHAEQEAPLPLIVRSLKGALAGASVDEEDFRRHLEEKYG
jgi:hypothetical protein